MTREKWELKEVPRRCKSAAQTWPMVVSRRVRWSQATKGRWKRDCLSACSMRREMLVSITPGTLAGSWMAAAKPASPAHQTGPPIPILASIMLHKFPSLQATVLPRLRPSRRVAIRDQSIPWTYIWSRVPPLQYKGVSLSAYILSMKRVCWFNGKAPPTEFVMMKVGSPIFSAMKSNSCCPQTSKQ